MSKHQQLVVKVCDTSDINKEQAAKNEATILQKIECELINQFVAFYEDPEVNKSYLVLEFSGYQSLTQFISEKTKEVQSKALQTEENAAAATSMQPEQQQLLSEEFVRAIMR